MEMATMGRVLTEATVENLEDLWAVKRGLLAPDQVRRVTIPDALVDKGATLLALPASLIQQLGLTKLNRKRVTSSLGVGETDMYGTARLTIQGRSCPIDVMELPNHENVPALVGQIPLVYLDFVVDPRARRLVGNPAHDGEQMFELF